MAIHLCHHDEIALITLDRPEALNALSFGQLHDLNRILDSIPTARRAPSSSPAPATAPSRPGPTSRS